MSRIIDTLLQLDEQILLAVNGMHNAFGDVFMSDFSGRFIWVAMYVAMFYALVRKFGMQSALIYALGAVLVIVFADQMCASLIRPYVGRLRPSNLDNPLSDFVHIVDGHRGGAFGFPSCHAANTIGAAVYMSLLLRSHRFTSFIFLWAIVTCWSRMYLGVHYLGDLLAGGFIGSIGGFVFYLVINWMVNKYKTSTPDNVSDVDMRVDVCKDSDIPIIVGALTLVVIFTHATCVCMM